MKKLFSVLLLAVCTIASKCNCSTGSGSAVNCNPSCFPDSCEYWSNCTKISGANDSSSDWIWWVLAIVAGFAIFVCCICICEYLCVNEKGNSNSYLPDSDMLLPMNMTNIVDQAGCCGDCGDCGGCGDCGD